MCKRNPDSLRVAPAGVEQAECCQLSYAFEVASNRLKVKDTVASAKLLQQAEQYDEVCIHCTHWASAERIGKYSGQPFEAVLQPHVGKLP